MVFKGRCSLLPLTLAVLVVVLLLAATARPALAHDGGVHSPAEAWAAWSLEPGVIAPLALAVLLFARGHRALLQRTGVAAANDRPAARRTYTRRAWAFGAGMAVLALALVSPVDALSGELFWVHMVQHNLLMLAAAPLLVLSYPLPQLLLGLPAALRRALGRAWARAGWLRGLWSLVSSPLAAWLLSALLLWAWHAPSLYTAAVANESVHALQHISFFGSALLFWWVVLQTYAARQAGRGMGVLYLFTTTLHGGLLGALLTFAPRVWVPLYAGRAETWGISALADQQLAGTIMWVPAGMVHLAAALWLLKSWLDDMEEEKRPTSPTPFPGTARSWETRGAKAAAERAKAASGGDGS